MTHGSLFSGIGGFDLAAEWMGWENKFHCEWNSFGQKVLHHYWPNAEQFTDITKSNFTKYANQINILTGGFPCQPYSSAGKRLGKEDERHLWPEMLRAIREIQPRWVVGENVLGLVNWSGGLVFHEVQADLEAQGYEVFPYVLNAASVGAPHKRDRVWFIAHADNARSNKRMRTNEKYEEKNKRWERQPSENKAWENRRFNDNGENGNVTNSDSKFNKTRTHGELLEQQNREKQATRFGNVECTNKWQKFPTQSPVCNGNDGLSDRLDGITFPKWRNESIKAGGNAIVPQVALQIFKAIQEYENLNT